jgi:hypothetical protein
MSFRKRLASSAICAALTFTGVALPVVQANAGVFVGVGVSVNIAPPPLPVYVQPALPESGYLWTPGYWAYGDAGYFWVPGVWVRPPSVGLLWTPGYWGFIGGAYGWHGGYWGPHVGFYGGVNYGYGYGGIGFVGGEWRGGGFAYNRAVANFGNTHVTNVYNNTTIVNQNTVINNNHTSFNGAGGIEHQPTPQEAQFGNEQHTQPTADQMSHRTFASQDRGQLASVNHGQPATMAAASNAAYHQTAQQSERTQPITAADRSAGKAYQPNGREANQDQRIANGLKTGQMTSGEAARADQHQAAIDQQVHNDRAANGGTLTGQERQQVNREQNGASGQIYGEKHNGNTVAPNAVDNREANQQQRTANGLRSGEETSGEAGRTDQRQSNLDQRVHNQRVANGGALNQRQRQQANQRLNNHSRQINQQKHNANTHRPPPKKEG